MLRNKQKQGFSLIEVLVATSIFAIIMVAAMNIFALVIDSQRSAIATQNVEESLKYFLEVTAKEIRMAKRNNLKCFSPLAKEIYGNGGSAAHDRLYFKNYHDECVEYYLSNGRFMIKRGNNAPDYISPAKIYIDELYFEIEEETASRQPAVTMELVAHALGKEGSKSQMRIQTTLTSRYYKIN